MSLDVVLLIRFFSLQELYPDTDTKIYFSLWLDGTNCETGTIVLSPFSNFAGPFIAAKTHFPTNFVLILENRRIFSKFLRTHYFPKSNIRQWQNSHFHLSAAERRSQFPPQNDAVRKFWIPEVRILHNAL